MKNRRERPFDILCAGELLVDFISSGYAESLDEAKSFERHMGGSPANLCMNMARLGNKASLTASVGMDDMGSYLIDSVKKTGVDCSPIRRVDAPTTAVFGRASTCRSAIPHTWERIRAPVPMVIRLWSPSPEVGPVVLVSLDATPPTPSRPPQ